ncbi:uncharacterized protein FPRO_09835 [Fusarium proliferatum ET1]|uniref:Uncharacterized protein n=1 Tax=Fusarium proliferatum (strain ET1) TaxID=1227346 RepID=A0A1L7VQ99_FUSPR|nr:uncharacterized protein FPRO_09835 [Fusarium proliferatum ET1]CZR42532.1 uncharacterized protein FPRO_09835 [Fusarium proliferatum ET1]
MSPWTPINARQVEEKKRAQARSCHWCVILGPLEERRKYGYPEGCCCEDKTQRHKEEEAPVKAETGATVDTEADAEADTDTDSDSDTDSGTDSDSEATMRASPEVLPQAAPRRPVVNKWAGRTSKVNNRKTCTRCNGKEYNMSNFKDHEKVHYLEDNGVPARFPCDGCKEPGKCRVARYPQRLGTYACISCLRSHKPCGFNKVKAKKHDKCKPGVHPALLRPIN